MSEPAYPNREHKNEDRAARRRAAKALDEIEAEVKTLRRKLAGADNPLSVMDGDDTGLITGKVRYLTQQLAIIGVLREVRDWAAADRAQAARSAEAAYERWIAGEAGPAYAGNTDVRDGYLDGYHAALGGPGEA